MEYLWLVFVLLSALTEALTRRFWVIGFALGALVAMILAFCDVAVAVQVAVFAACGILSLIFIRPLLATFFVGKSESFSIESAVGEKCVVAERIDNLAGRGAIILNGFEWAARTVSDELTVEEGERVEIIAVEGVKLICKKL